MPIADPHLARPPHSNTKRGRKIETKRTHESEHSTGIMPIEMKLSINSNSTKTQCTSILLTLKKLTTLCIRSLDKKPSDTFSVNYKTS